MFHRDYFEPWNLLIEVINVLLFGLYLFFLASRISVISMTSNPGLYNHFLYDFLFFF